MYHVECLATLFIIVHKPINIAKLSSHLFSKSIDISLASYNVTFQTFKLELYIFHKTYLNNYLTRDLVQQQLVRRLVVFSLATRGEDSPGPLSWRDMRPWFTQTTGKCEWTRLWTLGHTAWKQTSRDISETHEINFLKNDMQLDGMQTRSLHLRKAASEFTQEKIIRLDHFSSHRKRDSLPHHIHSNNWEVQPHLVQL